MWIALIALICLGAFIVPASVYAAPWIAADWANMEPQYSPGSLFWKTNNYPDCPILYRTVLDLDDKQVNTAGFSAIASGFAYVFLNGSQIASYTQRDEDPNSKPFHVELGHLLKLGRNVLIISASRDGFSLEGSIEYSDGSIQRLASGTDNWKAQKFPSLTMLEHEDCMRPDFHDDDWFAVKENGEKPMAVFDAESKRMCDQFSHQRMLKLDKDAEWRIRMLLEKGIAVADWQAYGWAGAERLPDWILNIAQQALDKKEEAGWLHHVAESLTWYIRISDDATNLENYVTGLGAIEAPAADIDACEKAGKELRAILEHMEQQIRDEKYVQAAKMQEKGKAAMMQARSARLINNLCWCLDNKFGWFDVPEMMDNCMSEWGMNIDSPARTFSSPLSPATFITSSEAELVISGWEKLEPLKVYNKPPKLGPVCLWAVLDDKVTILEPGEDGVVYDLASDGELSENWMLLVSDLSAGGHLPTQLVFLESPQKIAFKAGEKGTSEIKITFDKPGARLFALRPLKEWRGLLQEAKYLKDAPLNETGAQEYIQQCRFWSRSLMNYPVTFSEVFMRDPQNNGAILCADVYNYWELKDEWNTEPIRIAPLPPLATYGLMMQYPGLEVVSEAENLGSRGIWGDHIAAVGQSLIVYRVPIDPIKRFGGFTSYCFGGTDIGEPGSLMEIETIKITGANSFRPQHNQTGERAMRTLQWCWERGIQNVFNTDEKWVPDVVEHFRTLAEKCKDFPPDAVAYDLLNEPETRDPRAYDALIRKITQAIREVDKTHLIYVEVFPPWGPSASPFPRMAFENLTPTGDELTCYSFHDYEFRLPPRWPNDEQDIRSILSRWIPAFRYGIDSRRPIHLGEFGGFEQTDQSVYDNPCTLTLMMDYLRIFDQFGWHWHYYANRGTVRVRRDGSLQESYVQEAHRQYFAGGTFNSNR